MQCPEDRNELDVGVHDGNVGHGCHACGGMWLPAVFIESLATDRELRLADFYGTLSANAETARAIECPTGCGALACARIHGVEVDWCPECRGAWFNRGEINDFLAKHPVREVAPCGAGGGLAGYVATDVGLNVLLALLFP